MKKIKLAVVFGGKSGEHEVSLASVKSVLNALDKNKYDIVPIAITKKGNWLIGEKGRSYFELNVASAGKEKGVSVEKSQSLVSVSDENKDLTNYAEGGSESRGIDLVLPILHGPFGEDGRLQGMLDMLGVPYVFSGVLAHALAMNKPKAKIIAKSAGLTVAKSLILREKEEVDEGLVVEQLAFPVVVKPIELGSSVGMTLAKNNDELKKGIAEALKHSSEVMLEEYIKGRELTVPIMGNGKNIKALPVIEIIPKFSEWFDYKAKYEPGATREVCPAEIPMQIQNKIQKQAVEIYKAIGCKDLARADFIWEQKSDELYFLEINTIPGMTATSLVPQSAQVAGIEFSVFLDKLIEENLTNKEQV